MDVQIGEYKLVIHNDAVPAAYQFYCDGAKTVHEHKPLGSGKVMFVGVGRSDSPELVICFPYSPTSDEGFNQGVIISPETKKLFIGAGQKIFVYDLNSHDLVSEHILFGFWGWQKVDTAIIHLSETEIGAWSFDGKLLWEMFADPPHSVSVHGSELTLKDFDGEKKLDLMTGQVL